MVFCLDNVQNCTRSLLKLVSGWLPRHVIGAVLVSLPAVSVFSHLAYSLQLPIQVSRREGRWPPHLSFLLILLLKSLWKDIIMLQTLYSFKDFWKNWTTAFKMLCVKQSKHSSEHKCTLSNIKRGVQDIFIFIFPRFLEACLIKVCFWKLGNWRKSLKLWRCYSAWSNYDVTCRTDLRFLYLYVFYADRLIRGLCTQTFSEPWFVNMRICDWLNV